MKELREVSTYEFYGVSVILFKKQCQQFQIPDSIGKSYTLPFYSG